MRPLEDARVVPLYFASLVVSGQLLSVSEQLLGLHLPPWVGVSLLIVGLPIVLTVLGWRWLPEQDVAPPRWAATGVALYALWAAGYFLIGIAVDPARYVTFDGELERRWPFWPAASLVYLGVHPLFLSVFLLRASDQARRRMVGAVLGVLAVSFAAWSLYPVTLPRAAVPADSPFGAFVLEAIYGSDPVINCLPSTHCAMALLAALHLSEAHRRFGAWALLTALAIGASTVLTRQHYLVDVGAGYLLGGGAYGLAFWLARR